jgi:hypothetical protein
MQITNQKGEKLYLLTIVRTNEVTMPFTSLVTWDEAQRRFNNFTREREDDSWSKKIVKLQKTESRLYAVMITNQKGCGPDYFEICSLQPAYYYGS